MLGTQVGKRINQYVPDYVVFDLETTGISWKSDQVVEISATKVIQSKVVDEFSTLVNPGMSIPFQASSVNGITDAMVQSSPTFDLALTGFFDFTQDLVLVGHNIHTFDMKFLYRDAEKYFGLIPENDYIDTLYLARNFLTDMRHYKLVDLAARYGISQEGAHRALNDCRMNQQVFECIAKEMNTLQGQDLELKICPKCSSIMKKRNGKFGSFWGCSAFPECRYTENIK